MAIERAEDEDDELYENLHSDLQNDIQNVENDFIIRKAQMQQMRQQNKKKAAGNKRGKQSNQNSMNQSPSATSENQNTFKHISDNKKNK